MSEGDGSGGAGFLEFGDLGGILFGLAARAGLLDAQVVELLLVGEEGFRFNEDSGLGGGEVPEFLGKLKPAESVDARFERRNARQRD